MPILVSTSDGSEPRLGSDLGSAGLGFYVKSSARAIFQKARVEKNGKNEPIWGLLKKSIWKSLNLTKKINFFLYNSPKGQFSVKILVKIGQKSQI